jgi:hypothetical protein
MVQQQQQEQELTVVAALRPSLLRHKAWCGLTSPTAQGMAAWSSASTAAAVWACRMGLGWAACGYRGPFGAWDAHRVFVITTSHAPGSSSSGNSNSCNRNSSSGSSGSSNSSGSRRRMFACRPPTVTVPVWPKGGSSSRHVLWNRVSITGGRLAQPPLPVLPYPHLAPAPVDGPPHRPLGWSCARNVPGGWVGHPA